jgi:hypothetical protein
LPLAIITYQVEKLEGRLGIVDSQRTSAGALIAELDALLAMDVLRPVYSSPAASVVSLGELPTP